jgi:exodeoxyribonuclease V beta subunit
MKKNCTAERMNLEFFRRSDEFFARHADWLKQTKKNLLLKAAHEVHGRVIESKRAAQNISFDDLISQLSNALNGESTSLKQKIIESWPMAMVDEFQDTDQRQYHIFKSLYQSSLPGSQETGLILIGDPKQAIYSFRGADVFTYQQAKSTTAAHFTLEVNYRSSADYIDMVNHLFEHNEQAFVFRQLIEYYPSLANPDSNKTLTSKGQETLAPLKCWIHPWQQKPVSKAMAENYFADRCANEIAEILSHKTLLLDNKPAEARDLTILVRTGKQAALMKQQLAQRGISSALILRDSVFDSEQAREISRLLEVLINPMNISRLSGLLSTELFGWDAAQIHRLQTDNQLLVECFELMKQYQQIWMLQGILSMFFKLLADQHTLARSLLTIDGERRMTNWLHIVELLQQQSSQHASLSQSLHWLLLQREQTQNNSNEEHQLRLESDNDLVRIVTIHKSKGLQYPVVFLPFMWSVGGAKKAPSCYSVHDDEGNKQLMILDDSAQQRWQQEALAEEVRLFYVAMTRAVYRCYLGFGHISSAGSSALAQCLFSEKTRRGRTGIDLDLKTNSELLTPFEVLNAERTRLEISQQENSQKILFQESKVQEHNIARTFTRALARQWQITSYSQLALSGSAETIDRPDYDAVATPQLDEEEQNEQFTRFSFQKGAKAGTFLHDLLEHQPFDQEIDIELVQKKSEEYGFDEQWLPCLSKWMQDVLETELENFSLCDLNSEQVLNEMEFYLSCDRLKAVELNQLLFENQYSQSIDAYHFSTINGYLKGFIDLVFEHDGQYFVADYKSNYLGAMPEAYGLEHCRQAMFEHHYHLQYLIYTLALHRYLQQRLENYDYDRDIGGVYYLFLRGMPGRQKRAEKYGIFYDKPARQLIEKLDELFRN